MSNISKAIKTTRAASSILAKARNKMLKSSFNTAKQLAGLYKDAGLEAFKLGKNLVQKTVKLTLDNQKELLQTSGEAIKEAAQSIRTVEAEVKAAKLAKASKNKTAAKPAKRRGRKPKKEVTIDDLL